jgi:hypothetical protein
MVGSRDDVVSSRTNGVFGEGGAHTDSSFAHRIEITEAAC